MIRSAALFLAAGLASAGVTPAVSALFESAYTELDTERCAHFPGHEVEDHGFWRCRGYAGIGVRVAVGDQRTYVSFGPRAQAQPAAAQTFSRFNSIGKTRLEWRLGRNAAGALTPFAVILRWNVKIDDDRRPSRGRVLVVIRLGDSVCHVGYVDALANPNANELARRLADEHARSFDCAKDRRLIVGARGASIIDMAEAIEGEASEPAHPATR